MYNQSALYATFNEAVVAKVDAHRQGWVCGPVKGDPISGYYFCKLSQMPTQAPWGKIRR